MALWEILVIMITATVCLCAGVSVIADSILNAIDRYKSKRAVKMAKVCSEVMGKLPDVLTELHEKLKE